MRDIPAVSFPSSLSSSPLPSIEKGSGSGSGSGSGRGRGRTVQVLVVDDSIVQRKMCRVLLAGKVMIMFVILYVIFYLILY
jgi:hypothetical protein